MSRPSKSERVPLLCYVTDRRGLVSPETFEERQPFDTRKILLEKIAAAAAAGVDWIQIREKDFSGKECSSLAREAVRLAGRSSPGATAKARLSSKAERAREQLSTRILVNDRLDVALAVQAGGVHLGEKSLPAREAQRLVKSLHRERDFLIGVSCHSLEAAKAAESGGADYLFFGPVFATPSKATYGAPQGLKCVAEVCRAVAIPVLAIGGITLENAADCLSAGASGIAAIRLFQDAPDLTAIVRALRGLST
ncbi:MAG TPA: thiamine phosphate synthase [Candidatus Acidoferrum sp.]|nr:thiamine phosphate synthase [Candidatus Acidoferrum sp.]